MSDRQRATEALVAAMPSVWAIMESAIPALSLAIDHGQPVAAVRRGARRGGSVAVLPVVGTITQRESIWSTLFGGATTEGLMAALHQAVNDPGVQAVVLDVDSPGGTVAGVPELAAEIYRLRGRKPIIAVANSLMASAAYYIGSAADEVVVTPSAEVGSIGVVALHANYREFYERMGVHVTVISAGRYKAEGYPYDALTDEARAAIQARVDDYYGMFTRAVARHRDVPVERVRNEFGQGRVVGARQAVELGMADRIGTLDETIRRLGGGERAGGAMRAEEVRADDAAEDDGDLDRRRRRLRLMEAMASRR